MLCFVFAVISCCMKFCVKLRDWFHDVQYFLHSTGVIAWLSSCQWSNHQVCRKSLSIGTPKKNTNMESSEYFLECTTLSACRLYSYIILVWQPQREKSIHPWLHNIPRVSLSQLRTLLWPIGAILLYSNFKWARMIYKLKFLRTFCHYNCSLGTPE